MTIPLIISVCILLLLSFVFDITSKRTKIPSVIMLVLLGWTVKQLVSTLGFFPPNLSFVLPIFGTIGLVLIVLEGSLELDLHRDRIPLIKKSIYLAFFPMILFACGAAYVISLQMCSNYKNTLTNIIPIAIISSAIAIPSARNLQPKDREFVVYESSLSDIFGVILFNFFALNEVIDTSVVGFFILEFFITIVITLIATIGLSYLLEIITTEVKFVPIIIMILLIYSVAKHFHLPSLIFISMFGLFLGNLEKFSQFSIIKKLKPKQLKEQVHKFREITKEIAFTIRALFFLVFGYTINEADILNVQTSLWSVSIIAFLLAIRYVFLKLFKLPIKSLLLIAPRGLITILLFLSIPAKDTLPFINNSLVTQVIIGTSIIMAVGMILQKEEHIVPET